MVVGAWREKQPSPRPDPDPDPDPTLERQRVPHVDGRVPVARPHDGRVPRVEVLDVGAEKKKESGFFVSFFFKSFGGLDAALFARSPPHLMASM